jgi:hypothetical protein
VVYLIVRSILVYIENRQNVFHVVLFYVHKIDLYNHCQYVTHVYFQSLHLLDNCIVSEDLPEPIGEIDSYKFRLLETVPRISLVLTDVCVLQRTTR